MAQHAYVQKVLRIVCVPRFKDTPLPIAWRGDGTSAVLDDNGFDHYQKVVGILNWLAIKTRPDIRFAMTRLQYKPSIPNLHDLKALHYVVKYL